MLSCFYVASQVCAINNTLWRQLLCYTKKKISKKKKKNLLTFNTTHNKSVNVYMIKSTTFKVFQVYKFIVFQVHKCRRRLHSQCDSRWEVSQLVIGWSVLMGSGVTTAGLSHDVEINEATSWILGTWYLVHPAHSTSSLQLPFCSLLDKPHC